MIATRIWGENPPARAVPTLQSYLSRLRSLVSCEIHRRSGGYSIVVDEDAVDLHRFRRLSAEARRCDDEPAAALLREALACWRGPAPAGLDTPWALRTREALHAERIAAELDHYDVQLRLGGHADIVAELTARADEPAGAMPGWGTTRRRSTSPRRPSTLNRNPIAGERTHEWECVTGR